MRLSIHVPIAIGPWHPFSKVVKEKFETYLTPVEVLIDNEAGNTKSTHLSKPYLHDIKQQWNLRQSKASGHPIACTTGGDISLQILMPDNFTPSQFLIDGFIWWWRFSYQSAQSLFLDWLTDKYWWWWWWWWWWCPCWMIEMLWIATRRAYMCLTRFIVSSYAVNFFTLPVPV